MHNVLLFTLNSSFKGTLNIRRNFRGNLKMIPKTKSFKLIRRKLFKKLFFDVFKVYLKNQNIK